MPRNAAILWYGVDPPSDSFVIAVDSVTQAPITGRIVRRIAQRATSLDDPSAGSIFIAKPDELLPASRDIAVGDGHRNSSYKIGDYVDQTPPARPVVTGGGIEHYDPSSGCGTAVSSCGESTVLRFAIAEPVRDDQAPAAFIAYAVYLERSVDEALASPTPLVLLAGPDFLSMHLDHAWIDSDAFISVSAIDFAGNESPRSEPYQVNASGIGCAVGLHRRRPLVSTTALLVLAGLAWVRRRRRFSA